MKRLLLLGAGHAHVHVLQALAKQPLAGVEVGLVSPYPRQIYSGMVPGLVAGHYEEDDCAISLEPLLAAAKVRFFEASVEALDADQRRVSLSDGRALAYEVASVDVGSEADRDAVPGAREHGLWVRPMERFVQHLRSLDAWAHGRALNINVVGGGAAGVELALALQQRFASDQVPTLSRGRVCLIAGPQGMLAGYPARTVRRAEAALRQRRVVVLNEACVAVQAGHVSLANGARLANDVAVMCMGASPAPWLAQSGAAVDERGFLLTGPTLQSSSHASLFAVGDAATRADAPHPRSGVYAVRAGPPLAANLRHLFAGQPLAAHHPQARSLNLLACGDQRAIASWGQLSAQGRWVWWWKDHIDRAFVRRYAPVAA